MTFNKSQPPTAQTPPASNNNQFYVAAYDFTPEEEGEIELKRGDRIRMIDQGDSNWWKGRLDNDHEDHGRMLCH